MKKLIESKEKFVSIPEKSAARDFVEDLCGAVSRHSHIPVDFNPRYKPHARIGAANNIANRVRAAVALNGRVATSELRGLYRTVNAVCGYGTHRRR